MNMHMHSLKSERLIVLIEPEMAAQLKERAERACCSVAEVVRRAIAAAEREKRNA
jgi:hypothetical protein